VAGGRVARLQRRLALGGRRAGLQARHALAVVRLQRAQVPLLLVARGLARGRLRLGLRRAAGRPRLAKVRTGLLEGRRSRAAGWLPWAGAPRRTAAQVPRAGPRASGRGHGRARRPWRARTPSLRGRRSAAAAAARGCLTRRHRKPRPATARDRGRGIGRTARRRQAGKGPRAPARLLARGLRGDALGGRGLRGGARGLGGAPGGGALGGLGLGRRARAGRRALRRRRLRGRRLRPLALRLRARISR